MNTEDTDVVVYEAAQIWSSVEYGNGLHKAGRFFVQLCDYDAVVAERDELRAYKEAAESQEPIRWALDHFAFGIGTTLFDSEQEAIDYSRSIEDSSKAIPLYATPLPADKTVTRQDIIDVLLSTRGQSEGVTADAILGLLPDKGTVAVSASTTDKPAVAEMESQKPVAWGAFYYGGKYRGQLYHHAFSEEQIDRYIANVHRSDDSITLRKGRLYAKPVPAEQVPDAIQLLQRVAASTTDKPAVAVPDVLQKLRLEVAEAINILAMCGDQTPVDQLGKKLADALNASAPSHSQQSARTCDDAVLHALEKAQPFVEMARESGIAGAREAEILMANVYDTVRDRCPSHESEQPRDPVDELKSLERYAERCRKNREQGGEV